MVYPVADENTQRLFPCPIHAVAGTVSLTMRKVECEGKQPERIGVQLSQLHDISGHGGISKHPILNPTYPSRLEHYCMSGATHFKNRGSH
jgi:hypothetical protein